MYIYIYICVYICIYIYKNKRNLMNHVISSHQNLQNPGDLTNFPPVLVSKNGGSPKEPIFRNPRRKDAAWGWSNITKRHAAAPISTCETKMLLQFVSDELPEPKKGSDMI